MITSYKYEGKNNEELLIDALTELKVTRDDVYFKQTTEEGKLFKAKKYIIEIIKKEDVINYIKKYINEFANKFGVKINSEVRESDGISVYCPGPSKKSAGRVFLFYMAGRAAPALRAWNKRCGGWRPFRRFASPPLTQGRL